MKGELEDSEKANSLMEFAIKGQRMGQKLERNWGQGMASF